jgi:cytochrome P450
MKSAETHRGASTNVDLPFGFDPLSRVFRSHLWRTYERMRREEPVHRSPLGMWVLTRYDDVVACLRDSRFGMGDFWRRPEELLGPGAMSVMGRTSLLFKDPPDHRRLRSLASRPFSPAAIERIRPLVEAMVDELLTAARERGAIDVIRDLAFPLPVQVIAEMLGVPQGDRDRSHHWTQSMNLSFEPDRRRGRRRPPDRGRDRRQYRAPTFCRLRDHDGADRQRCFRAAARFPGEIARLRQHPELVANAVEEFMRHESPVQFTARQPRLEVEIGGRSIPAGEHCLLIVAAANRDPQRFPDPDRLDVGRENAGDQISFGGGRHVCLGAPLARLECAVAFAKLIPLLDGAELATATLEWRDSFLNHALESLPVRIGGAGRQAIAS